MISLLSPAFLEPTTQYYQGEKKLKFAWMYFTPLKPARDLESNPNFDINDSIKCIGLNLWFSDFTKHQNDLEDL